MTSNDQSQAPCPAIENDKHIELGQTQSPSAAPPSSNTKPDATKAAAGTKKDKDDKVGTRCEYACNNMSNMRYEACL